MTNEWVSRSHELEHDVGVVNYVDEHTAVFQRAETHILTAFNGIYAQLHELEEQLVSKIHSIQQDQIGVLTQCRPSTQALHDFTSNIKQIDRAMAAMSAHAGNLSHIKLTLARAAALVSNEGSLYKLVQSNTSQQRVPFAECGDALERPVVNHLPSILQTESIFGNDFGVLDEFNARECVAAPRYTSSPPLSPNNILFHASAQTRFEETKPSQSEVFSFFFDKGFVEFFFFSDVQFAPRCTAHKLYVLCVLFATQRHKRFTGETVFRMRHRLECLCVTG